MENPIRRIRRELGFTRNQLCQVARMRLDGIYLVENGLVEQPQERLLRFVQSAGYDPDQLRRDYRAYRDHLEAEAARGLAGRVDWQWRDGGQGPDSRLGRS